MAFAGFGQPGDWVSGGARDVDPGSLGQGWSNLSRQGRRPISRKGNFNAAEIELRNAEREAPKDARIRALLAQVYLKLGNFAYAERAARAARDLNGPEADYILTLAEAMMRQGKFADIPVEIKPGKPRAGTRKQGQGGFGARGERAAQSDQGRSAAPGSGVAGSERRGGKTRARETADEVQAGMKPRRSSTRCWQRSPKSADAIALKGEILALRGDADGAIQRFDEALALDPGNTGARLARANLYLNRNDFTALDKDLEVVLKAAPQDFRANYLRALELRQKTGFRRRRQDSGPAQPRVSRICRKDFMSRL